MVGCDGMNRKPIQLKGNWMIGSYINAQPMRMKGESLTSLWEDEMFEGSPWKLPTLHGWLLPIFWSSKMNKHYLRMKNLASYSHQPLLTMLISYMWVSYLNLLVWYAFIWSDKSTLFFSLAVWPLPPPITYCHRLWSVMEWELIIALLNRHYQK